MTPDERTLIFSLIFGALLIFVGALRRKIKYGIPLRETYLMLWREGVVGGFKEFRKNFIPVTKKALGAIWGYIKEKLPGMVKRFQELTQPKPAKHTFTLDLYCALLAVANSYTYKFFLPVIRIFYCPLPSCIQVSLHIKGAVTDDIIDEIVWGLTGAFQDYIDACSLDFQFQAFPYVERNRIVVRLYYCEFDVERPDYEAKCNQIMQMRSTSRPITEADTYDRDF